MSLVIRNIEQLFLQHGLLATDLLIFRRPTASASRKDYKITVADFVSIVRGDSGDSDSDFVPADDIFDSDFTVVLANGKTFGKYTNGQLVPASGLTAKEVILLAAIEYINPSFSSFSVTGQALTVEVGTTLSGNKTFTWTITLGSGTVSSIDIYDITAAINLTTDTPNDGSQVVIVTTIQLNANGSTQQWRGVIHDTGQVPMLDINSSTVAVTARYLRFHGATSVIPTNSAQIRALPDNNDFQVANAEIFDLLTGTTQTIFVAALPPNRTIVSVIDIDALNADITANYVLQGNVNVLDAGGTNRAYPVYAMTAGVPYSTSHRHRITTA
jgi:hypothetical protein